MDKQLRYNAFTALSHYLLSMPDDVRIMCGWAMTSGKRGKWELETKFLYVDHTDEALDAWLDHFDITYAFDNAPGIAINLALSDGTYHRYDASQFYDPPSTWHKVKDGKFIKHFKDEATHYRWLDTRVK
jgi:hypothetical protein